MTLLMADFKTKLPPHCVIKQRKGYADVYFHVHPKDRPDGWPATINLGRTDKDHKIILEMAEQTCIEYTKFKETGIKQQGIIAPAGSIPDIIRLYKNSHYWQKLAPRTQKDYDWFFADLCQKSKNTGHPHIKHMTTRHVIQWLNLFQATPRRHKYAKAIISIVFGAAVREGIIERNIVRELTLSYTKKEKKPIVIWEQEDINKFVRHADKKGYKSLATAVLIGFETGQRPADLLKMKHPEHYDKGFFRFKQNKTGKSVGLQASPALIRRLSLIPKTDMLLCRREDTASMWTDQHASKRVRRLCDEIGLYGHQLKFLRHTVVVHCERAGNNVAQIASITGHSRKTVQKMLDEHYAIDRDEQTAKTAVENLSVWRTSQTKVRKQSQTK